MLRALLAAAAIAAAAVASAPTASANHYWDVFDDIVSGGRSVVYSCSRVNDPWDRYQSCLSDARQAYRDDVAAAKSRNESQANKCEATYDKFEDLDEFNNCIAAVRADFDEDMANADADLSAYYQLCEDMYRQALSEEG